MCGGGGGGGVLNLSYFAASLSSPAATAVCVCGRVCGDVHSEREALHCGNATEIPFLVRMRSYIFFPSTDSLKFVRVPA